MPPIAPHLIPKTAMKRRLLTWGQVAWLLVNVACALASMALIRTQVAGSEPVASVLLGGAVVGMVAWVGVVAVRRESVGTSLGPEERYRLGARPWIRASSPAQRGLLLLVFLGVPAAFGLSWALTNRPISLLTPWLSATQTLFLFLGTLGLSGGAFGLFVAIGRMSHRLGRITDGDVGGALRRLDRAWWWIHPHQAHLGRARIAVLQGEAQVAETAARQLLGSPAPARTHIHALDCLVSSLLAQGRLEEAQEAVDVWIRVAPADPGVHVVQSRVELAQEPVGPDVIARLDAAYELAFRQLPGRTSPTLVRALQALAQVRCGRVTEARLHLEDFGRQPLEGSAIAQAQTKFYLAMAWQELGERERAATYFASVAEAVPQLHMADLAKTVLSGQGTGRISLGR